MDKILTFDLDSPAPTPAPERPAPQPSAGPTEVKLIGMDLPFGDMVWEFMKLYTAASIAVGALAAIVGSVYFFMVAALFLLALWFDR